MIKKGVFYIGGKKRFLVTAEYPYYRDKPEKWGRKLNLIKNMGVEVITIYLPWRHHQFLVEGRYAEDFTGKTASNRNAIGFIELCRKKGFRIIIKPGPFIHAETLHGGLPDFALPEYNKKVTALLDYEGNPFKWWFGHSAVPSPVCREFLTLSGRWYSAVGENIFRRFEKYREFIIAVQVLNEGLYSLGPASLTKYDFSEPAIKFFGKTPPDFKGIRKKKDITRGDKKSFIDWGEFHCRLMNYLYSFYYKKLKTRVPVICNLNPPSIRDFDAWLVRNSPGKNPRVNYGFTNWTGPVAYDEDAYYRYIFLAGIYPGINMEENWGFSKLYDKRYRYPVVPFYQTLLTFACGAKGYNIYTACNTDGWDKNLDPVCEKPYPDTAPVGADLSVNDKYEILRQLNAFIKTNEKILLSAEPEYRAVIGFTRNQCAVSACLNGFYSDSGRLKKYDFNAPFLRLMKFFRSVNLDFEFREIKDIMPEKGKILFIVLPEMIESPEIKKIKLLASGGVSVVFTGKVPEGLKASGRNIYSVPAGAFSNASLKRFFPGHPAGYPAGLDVFERKSRRNRVFYIFSRRKDSGIFRIPFLKGGIRNYFRISLPAHSACALILRETTNNPELMSFMYKGKNEYEKKKMRFYFRCGNQEIKEKTQYDLSGHLPRV